MAYKFLINSSNLQETINLHGEQCFEITLDEAGKETFENFLAALKADQIPCDIKIIGDKYKVYVYRLNEKYLYTKRLSISVDKNKYSEFDLLVMDPPQLQDIQKHLRKQRRLYRPFHEQELRWNKLQARKLLS